MLFYLKMFVRRISKDLRQKELLPLKLLFFIHASTLYVLYPYITIHMRELGISVEETAIMSAVIPVVAIIMPPLAGMIADKIGNFKLLLSLFSTLGGLSSLLLLLVPVGRVTITYPDQLVVGISCNAKRPSTHLSLSVHQEHYCEPAHTFKYNTELNLESCGFICQAITSENDSLSILTTRNYDIQLHDINSNESHTYKYQLAPDYSLFDLPKPDMYNHRTLTNNMKYKTAIRKLSSNSFFFPTMGLFNFSCALKENEKIGSEYNVTNPGATVDISGDSKLYVCRFGMKKDLDENTFPQKFSVGVEAKNTTEDMHENRLVFDVQVVAEMMNNAMKFYPSVCEAGFGQSGQHVSINVPLYNRNESDSYKNLNLGSCAPRCLATTPRKTLCANGKSVVEIDMSVTFWSYMAVRVFIGMIGGTAFAMFEGAVIAILREKNADYGLQRIYASIGGMISSPLSGWLIDYYSRDIGYTDFRPAFYLYAALKIASGVLMLTINLEFKTPANNVVTDVLAVLKKVELIALFISCFILGTAWGYIESFLFWLLQDLGGSRSLMGFTITVGGIAGIPLLVMSGPIIKRIGHANVIFIGFIFYAIRLLGYSLIYNPWHCLIFEAMESVTSSLSFTAAVTYAAKLSSLTTDTSIQGMLGGLYYGVGKGAGSLIGGFLMELVGTRPTYQIFAAMTFFAGIIYFCFNYFYMRRHAEGEPSEKDEKSIEIPNIPCPDLPAGFVEVDLVSTWAGNPGLNTEESAEDGLRKRKDEQKNGYVNSTFETEKSDTVKPNVDEVKTKYENGGKQMIENNSTDEKKLEHNKENLD